jgi:hypothetical protein
LFREGGSYSFKLYRNPEDFGGGLFGHDFSEGNILIVKKKNIFNLQTINFSGNADAGNFTLKYKGAETVELSFDSTAEEIEEALNNLLTLEEVSVSGTVQGNINILFANEEDDGSIFINIGDNTLTDGGIPSVFSIQESFIRFGLTRVENYEDLVKGTYWIGSASEINALDEENELILFYKIYDRLIVVPDGRFVDPGQDLFKLIITDHNDLAGRDANNAHSQYLHKNLGGQTILESVNVAAGKEIDGIDLSEHTHDVSLPFLIQHKVHYCLNESQNIIYTINDDDFNDDDNCYFHFGLAGIHYAAGSFGDEDQAMIGDINALDIGAGDVSYLPLIDYSHGGDDWDYRIITTAGADEFVATYVFSILQNGPIETSSPN